MSIYRVHPAECVIHMLLVAPQEYVDMYSARRVLGLHKIFVYLEAIVHESTILSFAPPTCIAPPGAILLHDD